LAELKSRDKFLAPVTAAEGAVIAFKRRFAGNDKDLSPAFDDMASKLVKVVFEEASLR
jgi:hypothetical protein